MQAELKVVGGKQDNQVVPLPQGKFLIGREQDCHLRPNSELVSRHHCVVTCDEFGIRVRDLGSTNGTLVNGERIEKQVELKPGDKLVVGSLNFELVVHEAAPVAVAAGPADAPQPNAAVPAAPEAEAGSETMMNIPAIPAVDDTQNVSSGDTTMIPAQPAQPQAPPPPGYPPQPQFAPPPMQYPPGYGQFQPQPQMYPPQYPGMPYPQPMPGYPMPQQQMPMPHQPMPQAPAPAPAPPAADEEEALDVSLPSPSETGIKEEQDAKGSGGAGSTNDANPSNSAGDIIKQYITRRPGQ